MCTIFDQEKMVPVLQRAKPLNLTRKPEIVHCHYGARARYLSFKVRPVGIAGTPHRIKFNFGTEVYDRIDCRVTKIRGDQDFLLRLDSQRSQAVEDRVAAPKEIM